MIRAIWAIFGAIALALGTAGIFLPFLPTVPFLLLAAVCFGQASDRLHRWILNHRVFGPPIRDWRERGAISRKSKWLSSGTILAALVMSLALGFPAVVIALQAVTLIGVALFLWTRPDG